MSNRLSSFSLSVISLISILKNTRFTKSYVKKLVFMHFRYNRVSMVECAAVVNMCLIKRYNVIINTRSPF
ncbi:hypothetical protein Pan110_53220 [Gimesia panareensis]|nr:hypothetical protein Pan110_53220 [Gimesia panareensis]